jgi:hypothetical protein
VAIIIVFHLQINANLFTTVHITSTASIIDATMVPVKPTESSAVFEPTLAALIDANQANVSMKALSAKLKTAAQLPYHTDASIMEFAC